MNLDTDRIDDAVLALLRLGLDGDNGVWGGHKGDTLLFRKL